MTQDELFLEHPPIGKRNPERYVWNPKKSEPLKEVNLMADGEFGWYRKCPVCGQVKSIREWSFRFFGSKLYDQPYCGKCRHVRKEAGHE
jgi:hypothetical protein